MKAVGHMALQSRSSSRNACMLVLGSGSPPQEIVPTTIDRSSHLNTTEKGQSPSEQNLILAYRSSGSQSASLVSNKSCSIALSLEGRKVGPELHRQL